MSFKKLVADNPKILALFASIEGLVADNEQRYGRRGVVCQFCHDQGVTMREIDAPDNLLQHGVQYAAPCHECTRGENALIMQESTLVEKEETTEINKLLRR